MRMKTYMKIRNLLFIFFISAIMPGCASLFMSRGEKDYRSSMTKALAEDWKEKTGGLSAGNTELADPRIFEQSACVKDCSFEDFTLLNLLCADCGVITAHYCPSEKRYWISNSGGMAFRVKSYGPFSFEPTQKMLDYQTEKRTDEEYKKTRWWYPYFRKSKCD